MENTTSFLHAGSIGDVWASMPAMKEFYRKINKKVVLYLQNGQEAFYYEGATHPTRNKDGKMVMLNEQMINMMIPLLKEQDYIADARIWNGEEIKVDLNLIRKSFVNMPQGSLSRWYFLVYPDLACDLSKQYIEVPDSDKDLAAGKLIVARTDRYQNPNIDYSFLRKYEGDLIFSGTNDEYARFCMQFKLNIPKLNVKDFLELAQALKQAKGLLSNQTMIFQIAEGLKTPRIVELCNSAPNVIPVGEKAYDFYHPEGLEWYVEELFTPAPCDKP